VIHVVRIETDRQGIETLHKFVQSHMTAGLCIRSLESTRDDDTVSVRRLNVCPRNLVLSSALRSVGEFTWFLLGVIPACLLYEKVLMPWRCTGGVEV
jgi:hypothetical protein